MDKRNEINLPQKLSFGSEKLLHDLNCYVEQLNQCDYLTSKRVICFDTNNLIGMDEITSALFEYQSIIAMLNNSYDHIRFTFEEENGMIDVRMQFAEPSRTTFRRKMYQCAVMRLLKESVAAKEDIDIEGIDIEEWCRDISPIF